MEEKDFIINVGPHGTFRPSGKYQTIPEHIDRIFEDYEARRINKISLYFHGGLVNEKNGMDTAIKMAKVLTGGGQAPLCFVWETGLIETLSSNILKISETRLFNKLIKVLVKKLAQKLGYGLVEGRGPGDMMSDEEIEAELAKTVPFEAYTQTKLEYQNRGAEAIAMLPEYEQDLIDELEAEFRYLIEPDYEFTDTIATTEFIVNDEQKGQSRGVLSFVSFIKHVAVIAYKVIRRFINKRDHDFYPTIIEEVLRRFYIAELGAWLWNNMKTKSHDMWKDNLGQTGLNRYAGRYLLDQLQRYKEKYPDTEINLIGHSAGSCAICNLLNLSSASGLELKFNKILFLAPACRVDQFYEEVVKHPERMKAFRMYTMSDDYETKDRLVPFVYTHSLLYLISGILENKGKDFDAFILGLERHISGKKPYHSAEELIKTNEFLFAVGKNRIAFSKSAANAPDGMKTAATKHGCFDDDKPTQQSIVHFLQQVEP